ncbi:hypothetical protein [Leuconostoc pseudomesenteroides]|uniref:hypothetical protein n=1 Tax=Leuconostoc pseudomesenteroides TaxID=33968 RepID=UPI0032DFFA74
MKLNIVKKLAITTTAMASLIAILFYLSLLKWFNLVSSAISSSMFAVLFLALQFFVVAFALKVQSIPDEAVKKEAVQPLVFLLIGEIAIVIAAIGFLSL